ncbi:MAG: mevalonate kinase [Spirochaetota bacterium]
MSRDRAEAPAQQASGRRCVSAPASLLLLGEYAVLEEGGLGVAIAPDVRASAWLTGPGGGESRAPARASAGSADSARLVCGATPEGDVRWPGDPGLLGAVCDYLLGTVGPPPQDIAVDTSAFFRPDGRKRGFGSSASLAVALTAVWTGFDNTPSGCDRVRRVATEAHRAAQGGRGSGYDVAVSSLGGVVLFTGGALPRARRVELPWLPPVSLFEGHDPVATTGAVARFHAWRETHAGEARSFLERSNELVDRFVAASAWADARTVVLEYRDLTLDLGRRIGVPARVEPPVPVGADGVSKAVGAGDELGVILAPESATRYEIAVAGEGLRWE